MGITNLLEGWLFLAAASNGMDTAGVKAAARRRHEQVRRIAS